MFQYNRGQTIKKECAVNPKFTRSEKYHFQYNNPIENKKIYVCFLVLPEHLKYLEVNVAKQYLLIADATAPIERLFNLENFQPRQNAV